MEKSEKAKGVVKGAPSGLVISLLVHAAAFMLAGLLVVWAVVTVFLAFFVLRRIMRSQRTLEATARCVETEYPELGSSLINVVQLSSDTKNESRHFCEAAVNEAAAQAGKVRFEDAANHETRSNRTSSVARTRVHP